MPATIGKLALSDTHATSHGPHGKSHKTSLFKGKVPWSKAKNGPTDPLLVVEQKHLYFSKTDVGRVSTRTVGIRNEDTHPVTLDAVESVHADPFREFELHAGQSLAIEPGETQEIVMSFQPAKTGPAAQAFQLFSGPSSAGPEAEFVASGEGVDSEIARDDAETERRIERQDSDRVDAERINDTLRPQRAQAMQSVRDWEQRATAYNKAIAQWTLVNWQDFLGKTGGDYELHGVNQAVEMYKRLTREGLAKAGEEGAEELIKEFDHIGYAENPLVGMAIEIGMDNV